MFKDLIFTLFIIACIKLMSIFLDWTKFQTNAIISFCMVVGIILMLLDYYFPKDGADKFFK